MWCCLGGGRKQRCFVQWFSQNRVPRASVIPPLSACAWTEKAASVVSAAHVAGGFVSTGLEGCCRKGSSISWFQDGSKAAEAGWGKHWGTKLHPKPENPGFCTRFLSWGSALNQKQLIGAFMWLLPMVVFLNLIYLSGPRDWAVVSSLACFREPSFYFTWCINTVCLDTDVMDLRLFG